MRPGIRRGWVNKGTGGQPWLRRRGGSSDAQRPRHIRFDLVFVESSFMVVDAIQSWGGACGRKRDPGMTQVSAAISWLQQADQSEHAPASPQRQHRSHENRRLRW